MYVRTSTFEVPVDKFDAAIGYFRDRSLPELKKLPGLEDAELLLDREHGIARVIAHWSGVEDIESSNGPTRELRNDLLKEGLATKVISVEVYEVAVAGGWGRMAKAA